MKVADLHIHFPMHLVPDVEGRTAYDLLTTGRGRRRLRDRLRALVVGALGRFINYRTFFSGPRVDVGKLRAGNVGVALSVLYSPFAEMDLSLPAGAPPRPGYLDDVDAQIDLVEAAVARQPQLARVVRTPDELDASLAAGATAIVHCLEGGFHLGSSPAGVDAAVRRLAERGLAYITLAHLFWRSVATNAPALPFLPDAVYRRLFPQPKVGLTELGRAAVRAMVREGVIVDIAHMSTRSLQDTFALLDELDPDRGVPVIASHAGYRFGKQEYALTEETVRAVAARDGVVGLILAEHQILDGLGMKRTTTFEQSLDVLCRHIDRFAAITGSHRHVALGSDLDGFIKPTLAGLQSAADLALLEDALVARYGPADAELMLSGNVVRVLRAGWRRP